MAELFMSSVVIPGVAVILFSIIEALGGSNTLWQQAKRVGLDLCILSIGIVGGLFSNVRVASQFGTTATPQLSVLLVLINLMLAGSIMLIDKRFQWDERLKACLSVFFGVVTVAIPSGIVLLVGGR